MQAKLDKSRRNSYFYFNPGKKSERKNELREWKHGLKEWKDQFSDEYFYDQNEDGDITIRIPLEKLGRTLETELESLNEELDLEMENLGDELEDMKIEIQLALDEVVI